MRRSQAGYFLLVTALSGLLVAACLVWAETDMESLGWLTREDGPVEDAGAASFALAGVGFLIAARRSEFLKKRGTKLAYVVIVCWALLMFVMAGEEISWGQRIFGIKTPPALAEINCQNELEIHNTPIIGSLGGTWRCLGVLMLVTGLLMPLVVLSRLGRRLIQWLAYPVAPISYWLLIISGLIVGKFGYLRRYGPFGQNATVELGECLLGLAMLGFALHGAICPGDLFRVPRGAPQEGPAPEPSRASG